MQKKCFFCGSKDLIKDGFENGHQRVICKACGKRYIDNKRLDDNKLYKEYTEGKQTIVQLADKYGLSTRTISRHLEKHKAETYQPRYDRKVIVLMDATYTSKRSGIMVFKDSISKDLLWYKFLDKHETLQDYKEGIEYVRRHYNIIGGVCDGLKGLIQAFPEYPIQYCQFHQVKTVRSYLTLHPESKAGEELLQLSYNLTKTDKESFMADFEGWYERHKYFINERSEPDKNGKTHYTHKRLRSAWLSLKRNMPYLWVWYDNMDLGIPNTNNGIESVFTTLKTQLRLHNGMSKEHKKSFIRSFLKISLPPFLSTSPNSKNNSRFFCPYRTNRHLW